MTSTGPMLARHGGSMPTPAPFPVRSGSREREPADGQAAGAAVRPAVFPAVAAPRPGGAARPAGPARVTDLTGPRPVTAGASGPFWRDGEDEATRPVGPVRPVEQTRPDGGLTVPIPTGFRPEGGMDEAPSPSGIYDALLGGTSHRRVDRRWALRLLLEWPEAPAAARASKDFLGRAVRFAARNGINQFLALRGPNTGDPVHEIACSVAPESQTVYVEPSTPRLTRAAGAVPAEVTVVRADVTRPAEVLAHSGVRARLDLTRPIALVAVPGLADVADDADPRGVLLGYREGTARGSLLIFSQLCDEGSARGLRGVLTRAGLPGSPRSHEQTVDLVGTWEPIEPGLVPADEWHAPDERPRRHLGRLPVYASIGWH